MVPLRCRLSGVLLGGAVGDALGAPVDRFGLHEIRARLGQDGVQEIVASGYRWGAVTDATRTALYVADGVIRACRLRDRGGAWDPVGEIARALGRWVSTQGHGEPGPADGWLVRHPRLRGRRGRGDVSASALLATPNGSRANPPNAARGSAALVRVALPALAAGPAGAFSLGCDVALLTHGHPDAWLSAGVVAGVASRLAAGEGLPDAVAAARSELVRHPDHAAVLGALDGAVRASRTSFASPEAVEALGSGRTAETALAISLFCLLKEEDLRKAVLLAVNHSGASGITGCLAGQLAGVRGGPAEIPARWLEDVELLAEMEAIADDLAYHLEGGPTGEGLSDDDLELRYPVSA